MGFQAHNQPRRAAKGRCDFNSNQQTSDFLNMQEKRTNTGKVISKQTWFKPGFCFFDFFLRSVCNPEVITPLLTLLIFYRNRENKKHSQAQDKQSDKSVGHPSALTSGYSLFLTPYTPPTNQLQMPECGEAEQGRKKGNGARRCLETFTDRDYLERLPRDHIYPLVRQFLCCKLHTTWSEAQSTQTGLQCCK